MQPSLGCCWLLSTLFFSLIPTSVVASKYSPVPKYPDLYEASIAELRAGLDSCQFSSVDLVKAYLARIDEVNLKGPQLRAVIEMNPRAIQEAAELDKGHKCGKKRSPLHGIPILLKDNIASEGMNTTAGSYALLGSIYPGDATVTAKLRKAGAIILGKANMSEWMHFRDSNIAQGWSARGGQGTNPYYPGADPCGSSSGSAVATAIGLATGSLGTETVGSLICPASDNNVVGIKPTVGLTSRDGVIPISPHQDTIGPIARSVADAAAMLTVIAGRDNKDNYTQTAPKKIPDYTQFLDPTAIKGKRFGIPRGIFTNDAVTGNDPAINVEFAKALDTIRSLGGVVVDPIDLSFDNSLDDLQSMQTNMGLTLATDFKIKINNYLKSLKRISTGVTSLAKIIVYNDAHKDLEQPAGYEGQDIFLGSNSTSGYNSAYYEALRANLNLTRREIDSTLSSNKLDALVIPSDGLFIIPVAIAGYPMISVPLGFFPDNTTTASTGPNTVYPAPGVPFGLSFVGTAYSEPSLIGFAYAYEQRTQTRLKRRAYAKAIPSTQLKDVIH